MAESDRRAVDVQDESRIAELGYKQELRRDWTLLQNFGVSFSVISIVTGITTQFSYGLNTGGPGVMAAGWLIVVAFTFCIGLSMAEITSAVPTSGGPYFWAAILAPTPYSAFLAWLTGWFNFVGQFAVTTGISFGCAGLISTAATIKTNFEPTAGRELGIYAAILTSHILINIFGVRLLRYLNNSSIIVHSLGIGSLAIAVVAKAPTHLTRQEVFSHFYDGTAATAGAVGWSVRASPAYVAVTGVLLSQYTITGFDASAHLSEETHNAEWSAPIGVLVAIGCSAIFGYFLLLCLLFSIQDFSATVDPNQNYGQPVFKILVDVFGKDGALVLISLIIICVWHCGLFSLTSNSRMMFAFSRDRALPRFFDHVNSRFQSPERTICLAAALAFVLALPSLGSSVAFSAATSIATIGLYISYALPILIAVIWPRNMAKGPFNMGVFSRPVGIISCSWVCFLPLSCSPLTIRPCS